MSLTITVTAETDLAEGTLVEQIASGWTIADAAGGTYDEGAGGIAWTLDPITAGETVQRTVSVVAPTVPTAAGEFALSALFSVYLTQGEDRTDGPQVDILVAPSIIVDHVTLGQVDGQSLGATYLPVDTPIVDEQRFEVFRVRFWVRNSDSVPVTWTPKLEFRGAAEEAYTVVPAHENADGIAFYVAPEWRPSSSVDGGTEIGPESESLDAAALLPPDESLTEERPANGFHSMGVNPIAPFELPPLSFTVVEFSARATVDAPYLAAYTFRVTDAGTQPIGAVTTTVQLGPEPALELTPGQFQGIPADAVEPIVQGVEFPLAAPGAITATSGIVPTSGGTVDGQPDALRYALVAPAAPGTPSGGSAPAGGLAAAGPVTLGETGFTSPHGPYTLTSDACAACHRSHTAQSSQLLTEPPTQSNICFTCHDGTGATANVKAQYVNPVVPIPPNDPSTGSYYAHTPLATPAPGQPGHTAANANEWQGAGGQPILNRHSECSDCHNSHRANSSPAQPIVGQGWTLSGALVGTSGVTVTNPPATTPPTPPNPPTYAWTPAARGTSISLEYQLCFKCHSGFTALPAQDPAKPSTWALDKAIELNPENASYHPIEAPGKNATPAMQASLAGTSPYKLWTFTTSSSVRCVNCHGDPSKFNPTDPPGAGSDLAPHTSQYRGILMQNYRDRLLKASAEAYAAGDFALCYLCHSEAPFRDTTGNVRTDTNFRFHGLHVSNIQRKGAGGTDVDALGAGHGNAICAECHFRIHSTALAVKQDETTNTRLVNFGPNVTTSINAWTSTGVGSGSCTLTCHTYKHSGPSYDTTPDKLTLTISADPTTFAKVDDVITFTYAIDNVSPDPIPGPFAVDDPKVGVVNCPVMANLAPDADPVKCTGVYAITAADVSVGSVTVKASASGAGGAYGTGYARSTVHGPLQLSVASSPSTYGSVGETITFTYVITNAGSATINGPFTVSADHTGVPPSSPQDCGTGTLGPGASLSCTATYAVTQADLDAGMVTNRATATNGTVLSSPAAASLVTALELVKTASPATFGAVDDPILYTYVITNRGALAVDGPFTITDDKTAVTCNATTSLAVASSVSCTAIYRIRQEDVDAGSVTNTARAAAGPILSNLSRATVPRAP